MLLDTASVLALPGTLLLAFAYDRQHAIRKILAKGHETEGTVVEMRPNPGGLFSRKEATGEAPVVEYVTHSGNTLKHYSTTYVSPSPYQTGQKVQIWYVNYKSTREAALADDLPGSFPRNVMLVALVLCALGYPGVIIKLFGLF